MTTLTKQITEIKTKIDESNAEIKTLQEEVAKKKANNTILVRMLKQMNKSEEMLINMNMETVQNEEDNISV